MKSLRIIIGILLFYVLCYLGLSASGRYQPISVGLGHVEEYAWAPFGFYDRDHAWPGSLHAKPHPHEQTGGWHTSVMLIFYPLWVIDARYIHTANPMGSSEHVPDHRLIFQFSEKSQE